MKIFAFSFTFVLVASFSVKAQDCERAGLTMSAVRSCLYGKLDKELNSVYQPLYQSLSARNPTAAALLQKSQTTWEKFVEDSCAFTVEMKSKDMMREDAEYNCQVDFTTARIKVLKAWAVHYRRTL
jgi:uncharacterized protein YecT (DUF1311 family)